MTWLWDIPTKLILFYVVVLFALRLLGKKYLSQCTVFDFVSMGVLGQIVGSILYEPSKPAYWIVYAAIIWTGSMYLISLIVQHNDQIWMFFNGKPQILIEHGEFQLAILAKQHLRVEDVLHTLRMQGIFSVYDVERAVLEQNGSISVLLKGGKRPVSKEDMGIQMPDTLPLLLVIDGRIQWENLERIGKNITWMQEQLHQHGVHDVERCIYVEYTAVGERLRMQQKEES